MWTSRRALWHVCMCGSKWWWSLSFLCDRGKKLKNSPPPPPLSSVVCCVIWSLALTVTDTHTFFVAGYVLTVWWSCMQSVPSDTCTWQHESHSAKRRVCPKFYPTATSPRLLKKKNKKRTEKKRRNTSEQSFVLILGCREGCVSAWEGIGISTGFYCHSILKIHFCHRRIL